MAQSPEEEPREHGQLNNIQYGLHDILYQKSQVLIPKSISFAAKGIHPHYFIASPLNFLTIDNFTSTRDGGGGKPNNLIVKANRRESPNSPTTTLFCTVSAD